MNKKIDKYAQKLIDQQKLEFLVKKYDLAELIKNQQTFIYILTPVKKQTIFCCPKANLNLASCSRILSYEDAKSLKTLLQELKKKSSMGIIIPSIKPYVFYVNLNQTAQSMKIDFDNQNIKLSNFNSVENQTFNIGLIPLSNESELEA